MKNQLTSVLLYGLSLAKFPLNELKLMNISLIIFLFYGGKTYVQRNGPRKN